MFLGPKNKRKRERENENKRERKKWAHFNKRIFMMELSGFARLLQSFHIFTKQREENSIVLSNFSLTKTIIDNMILFKTYFCEVCHWIRSLSCKKTEFPIANRFHRAHCRKKTWSIKLAFIYSVWVLPLLSFWTVTLLSHDIIWQWREN